MLAKLTGWATGIHTIVWARVQIFLGALWAVLSATDLGPFLNALGLGRWTPVLLVTMGVITEYLRRYRADDV